MKPIEELMKRNLKYAKTEMNRDGDVPLLFILHTEDGFVPIRAPFANDDDRLGMLRLVQLFMLKYKAYAYSVIMEAYMREYDENADKEAAKADAKKRRLHKDPKSKEVLIVGYVGHDTQDMISVDLHKKGKGKKKSVTFGKPQKFAGMGGDFFILLPPADLIAKKQTEEQKEALEAVIALVCLRHKMAPIELIRDEEDTNARPD